MKLGVVSIIVGIHLLLSSSQAVLMVTKMIRDAMVHSSSSKHAATSRFSPLDGTHHLTQIWPSNGNGNKENTYSRRDLDQRLAPIMHLNQHFFVSRRSGDDDDDKFTTKLAANRRDMHIQTLTRHVRMKSDGEPVIF